MEEFLVDTTSLPFVNVSADAKQLEVVPRPPPDCQPLLWTAPNNEQSVWISAQFNEY